jgi:alkyldihydroxyacetonephosphate synthase
MRRFNGWGDDSVHQPVHPLAQSFLNERVGAPEAPRDASLDQVAAAAAPSRWTGAGTLPFATDPKTRVLNGIGQSFSDWIAVRTGKIGRLVDAVVTPPDAAGVQAVLDAARGAGAAVLPRGGGTSVSGHFVVGKNHDDRPVVALSMDKLAGLTALDESGCLATLGAGMTGPEVERALNARGFTLGHYPQSFELSTLGGWVACRSAGHFSLGYGRIEALFTGGELVTPKGTMAFAPVPATAAGPDLRQLALGSEGRLGVITSCTMKVRRVPEAQRFSGSFLPNADAALACVRELGQSGPSLLMIRLSLPEETRTGLALAGHAGLTAELLHRYLALKGVRDEACLVLVGAAGTEAQVQFALEDAHRIIRKHKGVVIGGAAGNKWFKKRFDLPYLRNSLWDLGYGIDTFETALPWAQVTPYIKAVEANVKGAFAPWNERAHVFTHLSHVYAHGSSVYTSYIFRLCPDADELLARWQKAKAAASETVVQFGGTITHQHGVGQDHKPYLPAEKGPLGMATLNAVVRELDPEGLFNTGNLLGTGPRP